MSIISTVPDQSQVNTLSDMYEQEIGVSQGGNLSPVLIRLKINNSLNQS